jgi:hypothetical protein
VAGEIKYARSVSSELREFIQANASGLLGEERALDDPQLRAGLDGTIIDPSYAIYAAIVEYACPFMNTYVFRFKHSGGQGISYCINSGAEGREPIAIGSDVMVASGNGEHVILGRADGKQVDLSTSNFDLLAPTGGISFYHAKLYSEPYITMAGSKLMPRYSRSGVYDGLSKDKTYVTSSGVTQHIDDDMAFLRTSEICGLFLFREDGVCRLSGETLETESLVGRSAYGIGAGTSYGIVEKYFYPWELLGNKEPTDDAFEVNGGQALYKPSTQPLDIAQDKKPIARLREFEGALGHGSQLIVSAPVFSGDNHTSDTALLRQYYGKDGSFVLETVRQAIIAKVSEIRMPVLEKTLEESTDGKHFLGASAEKINDNAFSDNDLASKLPLESYLNTANWQANSEFVRRDFGDVSTPETEAVAKFDIVDGDQIANPETFDVDVDEAFGKITVAKLLSLFGVLPNGDIVLQNGLGASIRLSKGNVYVDGLAVHVNAGKNFTVASGKISLKANDQLEASSSTGQVRIKAETMLSMLGGNSRRGGVLIESRGVGDAVTLDDDPAKLSLSGIVLKSPQSHVGLIGGAVVLKTGPTSAGNAERKIIIDSGNNETVFRASAQRRYAKAFYDHFGTQPQNITRSNLFFRDGTILSGNLFATNSIVAGSAVYATRGMYTAYGAFATGEARRTPYVFRNPNPQAILTSTAQAEQRIYDYSQTAQTSLTDTMDDIGAPGKMFASESLRRAAFGFPSSDGYGASNQMLFQPYWQTLPINNTFKWVEPSVLYPTQTATSSGTPTMPWPGYAVMNTDRLSVVGKPNILFSPTKQCQATASTEELYKQLDASKYDAKLVKPLDNMWTVK